MPVDEFIQQAMLLLSPKWQQESQQQLLLTSGNSNSGDSTTVTAAPLKLDYTTLASVLKLREGTDTYYAAAVEFLVKHTGFVSYAALADIHSEQPLIHDTQGNHTIGVSSELICKSLWNRDTVTCNIDEYGIVVPTTTASASCDEWLTATAVVPIQANLSLDILNSAITLSEKVKNAEVFSSNVIGAIIDLHLGLHAEKYWTTKAKESTPITLALLAYYTLYFGVLLVGNLLSNSGITNDNTYTTAPLLTLCWKLTEVIISWCILTTAAVYKLDLQAIGKIHLYRRATCLLLYYGWALASTVILASARVQSQSMSINMTTVTAVVLLLMSLLSPLQLSKQTVSCYSRLFHLIPQTRAWLATCVISYIAHSEVGALVMLNETTIADYKQGLCYWQSFSSCSDRSLQSTVAVTREKSDMYGWLVIAAIPGFVLLISIIYDIVLELRGIITNIKTVLHQV
jgi:uncharacterized integral membrane protein